MVPFRSGLHAGVSGFLTVSVFKAKLERKQDFETSVMHTTSVLKQDQREDPVDLGWTDGSGQPFTTRNRCQENCQLHFLVKSGIT